MSLYYNGGLLHAARLDVAGSLNRLVRKPTYGISARFPLTRRTQ